MNESRIKNMTNLFIAIICAIAIVVSSLIIVNGLSEFKEGNNRIIVTGSAKQKITSDLIVWTGSFSSMSPSLKDAYTELEVDKAKVLEYLTKEGVPTDKIVFSSINTYTNYIILPSGQYTSDIDYYELNQTVTISSEEIDKITEISRQVTELINEGIEFQSNAPQYMYTKIADRKSVV